MKYFNLIGTILMALALIVSSIVIFTYSIRIGLLFCCFIIYRIGYFLASQNKLF